MFLSFLLSLCFNLLRTPPSVHIAVWALTVVHGDGTILTYGIQRFVTAHLAHTFLQKLLISRKGHKIHDEFNTVDATGISDANYADSFVDIKAARTIVRYNTFIRNEAEKLEKGIAIIYRGTDYSAYEIVIHDNYYYLVSFEALVCGTLNTMDALVSNPSFCLIL